MISNNKYLTLAAMVGDADLMKLSNSIGSFDGIEHEIAECGFCGPVKGIESELDELYKKMVGGDLQPLASLVFQSILHAEPKFRSEIKDTNDVLIDDAYYELFDEMLDQYLVNTMTPDDVKVFECLLDTDSDLRDRARLVAMMAQSMQHEQALRDQRIVDTIKDMDEATFRHYAGLKPKAPKRTLFFWPRIVSFAAAACVAVILIVADYSWRERNQSINLGTMAYSTFTLEIGSESTMRGQNPSSQIEPQLAPLFDHVRDGKDIRSAIDALEPIYQQSLDELSDYYQYGDDIAWNLAIAYLKEGDRQKAREILQELVDRNEEYPTIAKPAKELIEKIEGL